MLLHKAFFCTLIMTLFAFSVWASAQNSDHRTFSGPPDQPPANDILISMGNVHVHRVLYAPAGLVRLSGKVPHPFVCEPQNDRLSDRSSNEAYCLAEPAGQYAVYFPDGGQENTRYLSYRADVQVRWETARSTWHNSQTVQSRGILELKTSSRGYWAA